MQGLESVTACCNAHACPILPAELLSKHTTFRIGGACQAMVQIANREGLQAILQCCQEQHLPWVVLGNGSNILAADEGYHGIVLQLGRAFPTSGSWMKRHCFAKPEQPCPLSEKLPWRHA